MSPASKSKSKDKSSSRAAKEPQKASSKSSSNTGSSIPASAYNPLSGTFHTLETAPAASSPPPHNNGRFRNIDETDEHSSSSLWTGAESDSISNNDSCSVESEEQKEKTTNATIRQEAIPGSDNDKRDKIRQKNERKHQRQRERRAQELHERCSGYLMSRKLEALSQQLVSMGFSSERATMALILNEGRLEESVAWLLEGSEEASQHHKDHPSPDGRSNLKIDISEELARIADMEIRYKCSKQDVERAVVACEGDLEKAAETLRGAQKQVPPLAGPPKPEENDVPPVVNGGRKLAVMPISQNSIKAQVIKPSASIIIQQRRDERDFNYTKTGATPVVASSSESGNRNLQPLKRIQPKSDKRWPISGSSPSIPYSLASSLQVQVPLAKVVVGTEVKNLPAGVTVKEPVIMMQRPQSINSKPNPNPLTSSRYPNNSSGVEILKSNGVSLHIPSIPNPNPSNNINSQQFYHQPHYKSYMPGPMDSSPSAGWGPTGTTSVSASSRTVPPSSLGLFSGWGPTGMPDSSSSSPIDWSTGGSMPQCDYTNIDWTLDSNSSSRTNRSWLGHESIVNNSQMYNSWPPGSSPANGPAPAMRSSNGNGVCISGLQEGGGGGVVATEASSSGSAGSHEWTSPFEGMDLFSIPRQFVTSPSL